MNFTHLPENVKQAVISLTRDDEFQRRFAKDKILDELEAEKYNSQDEYFALLTVLNGKFVIGQYEVNAITPAIWSFLFITKSPFVTSNIKQITKHDVDYILYILAKGLDDAGSSPEQIYMNSLGFCENNGIDVFEAIRTILDLIKISFRPLKMFSASGTTANIQPRFDADWLTGIAAKVHQVTGLTPKQIINEMSLTECCYYFAQYSRMNSTQEIQMKSDEQIMVQMSRRTVDLILERLLEINIIDKEDVQNYRKIMNTPENSVEK